MNSIARFVAHAIHASCLHTQTHAGSSEFTTFIFAHGTTSSRIRTNEPFSTFQPICALQSSLYASNVVPYGGRNDQTSNVTRLWTAKEVTLSEIRLT